MSQSRIGLRAERIGKPHLKYSTLGRCPYLTSDVALLDNG